MRCYVFVQWFMIPLSLHKEQILKLNESNYQTKLYLVNVTLLCFSHEIKDETAFSISTLSIMTLSVRGLYVTLSISDSQHKWHSTLQLWHYAECHYAECRVLFIIMAECHCAECHYAECHYAECRSAKNKHTSFLTI